MTRIIRDVPVIGIAQLWDGTHGAASLASVAHLQELTGQQPENGEAWRRLGNYYERYERMGQAEDAWQTAIEANQDEFEAAFSLAKLHFDADRPTPGVAFLRQAFERLPQAKGMTSDFRDTVADRMVEFLRGTLECTNRPVALLACSSEGAASGGQSGRSRQLSIQACGERSATGIGLSTSSRGATFSRWASRRSYRPKK